MTKLEFIADLMLQFQGALFRFTDTHCSPEAHSPEARKKAADSLIMAQSAIIDGLRKVVPDEEMP